MVWCGAGVVLPSIPLFLSTYCIVFPPGETLCSFLGLIFSEKWPTRLLPLRLLLRVLLLLGLLNLLGLLLVLVLVLLSSVVWLTR